LRRAYRALIAIGVAIAVVVVLFVVPVKSTVDNFDYSQELPTGTTYFNGQERCGANVTISNAFPSGSDVTFSYAQNESGADVNIWMVGPGVASFTSTGGPGSGHGEMKAGMGFGSMTLVFKACGPGATVDIGFWGTATYLAPLL